MGKKAASKKAGKRPNKVVAPPVRRSVKPTPSEPATPTVKRVWGRSPSVKHDLPEVAGPDAPREVQVISRDNYFKGLRAQAKIAYANDVYQRALRWWWSNHYSRDVAEATFLRWASEDRWDEARSQFWAAVEQKIQTTMAEANVKVWMDDLRGLDEMYATLIRQVNGDQTANLIKMKDAAGNEVSVIAVPGYFTSRGDAFRALTALDRRRDEKRKGVLGGLPPVGTGTSEPQTLELPQLTPREARAMARARLLAQRDDPASDEDDEKEGA